MKEQYDKIILQFNKYSELADSERDSLERILIDFASDNRDFFIDKIQKIEPSEKSVLFEIYQALAIQPSDWIDFIVSEFKRIQVETENAKSKDKNSTSSPLTAISFFLRRDFHGIDKLIGVVNEGLKSKSKQIVKTCLDLLADVYLQDKSKYYIYRLKIESFRDSQTSDISQLAKQIVNDFDNPRKIKRSFKWYSVYSFFVFIFGLGLAIWTSILTNDIFIEFKFIAIAFISGFILFGFVHYFLTSNINVKKSEAFAIGVGFGFISSFLILYLNLRFAHTDYHEEIYKISNKGNLSSGGRFSNCSQPYIEFERNNQIESINFYCQEQDIVDSADSIKIVTRKGLFNFDIIEKKKLIKHKD